MINRSFKTILYILLLIILLIFQVSLALSATVSGTVKIEGSKDKGGVLVTMQGRSLSGITNKDGKYSILNVPSGSFTIIAQKPGCLVGIRSDVVVSSENVTIDFQLIPGDLKIDNQINLLDRLMLTSVWKSKKGDANWNSMMDIYEDEVIDEKDKELLLASWKKGNPNVKLGSLLVDSNPQGASILINGADTGKTTPYTLPGMVIGEYIVTLKMENYAPVEVKATVKENQTQILPPTILDNQPPDFTNWAKDPSNLTEDYKGRFRVSVRVTDKGGSGLGNKIPQFDYHIGANTTFSGYKDMKREGADIWYYEISDPTEGWDFYRGKYVYYKVRAEDAVGNSEESAEQQEQIDDINDPPTVRIVNTFSTWEKGLLTVVAEPSDTDGTITGVRFEYSTDNANWTPIGLTITQSPYSIPWDTKTAIRDVMKSVWLKAITTDDDNALAEYITSKSFGIDNQSPTTTQDYDELWHNKDFYINLKASDGNGIGVSSISYKLNNGIKQDILTDGQSSAPVIITKEDSGNTLEYWSIDKLGNEEQLKTLPNIRLDKTAPVFSNWSQNPADLTEDIKGKFQIQVRVTDESGSGLTGKTPQIDYHIGTDTQYNGFKNMANDDGKVWYFDIFEPSNTWDAYRGKYIYYKVKIEDVAGNQGESTERRELIDDINDPPTVKIESIFNPWEKSLLTISAAASDIDGTVSGVQFEYSTDKANWKPIGTPDTTVPYSIEWDTKTSIPQSQTAWIRATATDNNGASATYDYPAAVGIDNQPPITSDDYNDLWHKDDFTIKLTASDGNGSGVSSLNIKYKLNKGDEKNIQLDGQPIIKNEGLNQLEYWSVDNQGNTETHHTIQNVKLDKTKPTFTDWVQDPINVIEDSSGPFRVSVRVSDKDGSGLTGKVPQFSYHIKKDKPYGDYVNMIKGEANDVWYYDIPEPTIGWDAYRGENIYYKARIEDVAGNLGESTDKQELIDDINDPPVVRIKTLFNAWERGSIKIEAEASDIDGTIATVQFDYSADKVNWKQIDTTTAPATNTITWDSKAAIPEVSQTVWIKAKVTDDDGLSTEFIIPGSFRIDNQPPVTNHDYDGAWHNKDFVINLTASDKNGIGVSSISYILNNAEKQEMPTNGSVAVPVNITKEGMNTLEYWTVDKSGNEETHRTLTDIKMDKTAPVFSGWIQEPANLIEDTARMFRILVQAADTGSGLAGKKLQIDYHIGTERYGGYKEMTPEEGNTWGFDIPEPDGSWNKYRGQYIFYKVKIQDVAGNTGESPEQKELIDSINDTPIVNLKSSLKDWKSGTIKLEAEASDLLDETVPGVQFEYSFDKANWVQIGGLIYPASPYSHEWDTKKDVPTIAQSVYVRATAVDAEDKTIKSDPSVSEKFGIDNQPPTAGKWTKSPENLTEDIKDTFRVTIGYDDGAGSGVKKVEIAYKIGNRVNRDFREMRKESGNIWYYDIIEAGNWDSFRGEALTYRARATDVVGNVSSETTEQQELIDDINDPPNGQITSTYKDWERGAIPIQANAADEDGQVTSVQFQYSPDNTTWTNIGPAITRAPFAVSWNTSGIDVDLDVWVRMVITDDDKATTEVAIVRSFGIDNQPPDFVSWKLEPPNVIESFNQTFLRAEVEITDKGSGVDDTKVQMDYHIGKNPFTGYRDMVKGVDNRWSFEISRPAGNWSSFASQDLIYKVKVYDKAGNFVESQEQKEYIDPTTGLISGTVSPKESLAKVSARRNSVAIAEGLVSQYDGSYVITGLEPGFYDLTTTALGYGTDKSKTNIEVKVGSIATVVPNIELYTYTVEKIIRSQSGRVEFKDKDSKDYAVVVESNTFAQDSKVVLGFSGNEPTTIPNPNVRMLGKAVGVGFEGKEISQSLKVILPRPTGFTDDKTIMAFIYNWDTYRFVDRGDINDKTITVTIAPKDVKNFTDPAHKFDKTLSKTNDTVFYVIIARFDEPQFGSSDMGIREPQLVGGQITSYNTPQIGASSRKVALIIHGITSRSEDFASLINDLKGLKPADKTTAYYDNILVFNYDAGSRTISQNSLTLMFELARTIPSTFDGKLDVIAHDTGALIARQAIINNSGDRYMGSLIMLGTPNGGVNPDLLKAGFASFLKKTQSDPVWTYYRDGWQGILEGSQSLVILNNQPGRSFNTYYYGIAASDPLEQDVTKNNDGLVYQKNVEFTNFQYFEQTLDEPKPFDKVPVTSPLSEGKGFMSQTRHVAMIQAAEVRAKIMAYLRGKSENIRHLEHSLDLIPGNRIDFKVTLKNVGAATVYGVNAKLLTQSTYITIDSRNNPANYGDITKDGTKIGTYSITVSPNATTAINQQILFELLIRNARDNSVYIETFNVPIGGNLVQIDLDNAGEKKVLWDVKKDTSRPENDGDIAIEPGETAKLDITLVNKSASSIQSVKATLKTDNPYIKGFVLTGTTTTTEVDMAKDGLLVDYGTLTGSSTGTKTFQLVRINQDFTPSGSQVKFTIDIKSGENLIGRDEFTRIIGANVVVEKNGVYVDRRLKPGSASEYIDVTVKNTTTLDIRDVEVRFTPDTRDVYITNDRYTISLLRAGSTSKASFETSIDARFSGYVTFTIDIRVSNSTVNLETYKQYFGMRTHYITDWIVDDGEGIYSDKLAEPGESIKLQIVRRNTTDEVAKSVVAVFKTTDPLITITRDFGDYLDIQAHSTGELRSRYEYEFNVSPNNPDDITVNAPSGSVLTATRLTLAGATWTSGAFVGGFLNPNTTSGDPQYELPIVNNGADWIDISTTSNMLDPNSNGINASDPQSGDPFRVKYKFEGHISQFTLDIEENRETMGTEAYTMRSGGVIRYLPPTGYTRLMETIMDAKTLDPVNNNGNGIPEPGETIDIIITLKNVSNDINVDNVRATLRTDERDVNVTYYRNDYGRIRTKESSVTMSYRFIIDKRFTGKKIPFSLDIEGRINNINKNLGTDVFMIPVGQ